MRYRHCHNALLEGIVTHLRGDRNLVDVLDRAVTRDLPFARMGETVSTPDASKGRMQYEVEQDIEVLSTYEGVREANAAMALIVNRLCATDETFELPEDFFVIKADVVEARTTTEQLDGAQLVTRAGMRVRFLVVDNRR